MFCCKTTPPTPHLPSPETRFTFRRIHKIKCGRARTFHKCKARLPSSPLLSCPRPSAAATLWAAFLSSADSLLGNTSSLSSLFANSRTRDAIWDASSETWRKGVSFDYMTPRKTSFTLWASIHVLHHTVLGPAAKNDSRQVREIRAESIACPSRSFRLACSCLRKPDVCRHVETVAVRDGDGALPRPLRVARHDATDAAGQRNLHLERALILQRTGTVAN